MQLPYLPISITDMTDVICAVCITVKNTLKQVFIWTKYQVLEMISKEIVNHMEKKFE
jgi:hypothetical protein